MIHLFNTQNGIRLIINNTEYDAFIYKDDSIIAHDDPWDIKTEDIWDVDAKDFPKNFRLSTSFKNRITPYVDIVRLEYSANSRTINLVSDYIATKWEHPCNIKHYLNAFKDIAKREYPDVELTDYSEGFEGFFGFNLIFSFPETGLIKDIIVDLINIYEKIQSNALSLLSPSPAKYPLQVSLNLPEHQVHAYAQYMTYFSQFLSDLGLASDTETQKTSFGILFSAMPSGKEEALTRVCEALKAYLVIPSLDANYYQISSVDIETQMKFQRFSAAISYLKSQLALSEAIQSAKEIELSAAKRALALKEKTEYELIESISSIKVNNQSCDKEEFFGGVLEIKKFEKNGIVINIPKLIKIIKGIGKGKQGSIDENFA